MLTAIKNSFKPFMKVAANPAFWTDPSDTNLIQSWNKFKWTVGELTDFKVIWWGRHAVYCTGILQASLLILIMQCCGSDFIAFGSGTNKNVDLISYQGDLKTCQQT